MAVNEPAPINPEDVERINAPAFYGSTIQAVWAGNDLTLVFAKPHPVINKKAESPDQQFGAVLETQAIISLSPQTAKDLFLLLQGTVKRYEDQFGVISTEYTQRAEKGDK
ncbi:hypothetical protein DTW90_30750 [Neorhizobium sp. P12A]|nr:hypothetical protein DTW90_30750 [Neorhizobium sp. P12A]